MSDEEQAHLFRLAGYAEDPALVPQLVPESVHRIVDQLAGSPVGVCDASWQLLYWNPLFAAAFGDPTSRSEDDRNALISQFEDADTRVRLTTEERADFEASLVADLRATSSRYPKDPRIGALLARLDRSPRFRELWALGSVGEHQGTRKTIVHPEVGDIAVVSNVLITQGTNLRLVVDTPKPGTDARSRFDLLAAIGIQRMSFPSGHIGPG